MGVHCEINLFKPPNGAFVPGSAVAGVIKYVLDKETVYEKIAVSLKGSGWVVIKDESIKKRNKTYVYRNSQTYIDIENIVYSNVKSSSMPIGAYELPFNFTLPQNIPGTLNFCRRTSRYVVRCNINYTVSIKFQKPGLFTFDKKFKKDLTVIPGIKPRLPTEPTIYAEQKKIFRLFSGKPNLVNIKANIESCVVNPGSKVKLNYEIFNHTNLNLKSVETKLVEAYTFTTKGHRKVKLYKDIENSDSKSGAIDPDVSQNMDIIIDVPSELGSIEYSNLVSRDYFVNITVDIPFPHLNASLDIPLQIGDRTESFTDLNLEDPPPSYWEAMAEDKNKDGDEEDDEELKEEGLTENKS